MLNVAEMTDTTGKVYSVDTDASETYDTSLDKKPFAPGEARSIKMVFDIGKTAKPKQVEVRGTDMKQDMQTFIAKF